MATLADHRAVDRHARSGDRALWDVSVRVRVFERDPDLLTGVDPRAAGVLRLRATAPRRWLEAGPIPASDPQLRPACLGLLVLDGLLIRSITLHGRRCPELLGPGDVLRPWDDDLGWATVPHDVEWRVLKDATLADLDESFATVAGRVPAVLSQLQARALRRARMLAFHFALAHVRHAEQRLLLLLWHLADRWGRVTPHGVLIPVGLTQELLADLACMRRPTASSTLRGLVDDGVLGRTRDGCWILRGAPPDC
ncbi:MAG TPA: helix-turn-helix domain-containing protein [Baekduia sp.]|nr:helix-turn-helix domain-containing protein [Baekduia sp.]